MKLGANESFNYDEAYFQRHFSSPAYARHLARRNRVLHQLTQRWVQSGRMLEIGFGDDSLLRFYRDSFDTYGVDISEHALKLLGNEYPPDNFVVADVTKNDLPFWGEFDLVMALSVIEHIENPGDVFQRIYTRLKSGGFFALHLPTASNFLTKLQYRVFYDVPEHIYRPSVQELRAALRQVGFVPVDELAAVTIPLRWFIRSEFMLRSTTLYFGIWRKP